MPKMNMSVPHDLGAAEATSRLQNFLTRMKEKRPDQVKDLEEEWSANSLKFGFSTFGFKIRGTLAISDQDVKADVDLPFAAMIAKGKIESEFRESLTRILRPKDEKPDA